MKKDRWTFSTALAYILKATYKGLTFWSAYDYLKNYHFDKYCMLVGDGLL